MKVVFHNDVAFDADDVPYRWADVFAFARSTGDWQIFEAEVRQGLACIHRESAVGPSLPPDAQRSAEATFRRLRQLYAGDDLRAWLGERCLGVTDWRRYIRGEALRQRWAAELDEVVAAAPEVEDEEMADAVRAWGLCSERFGRWARGLAARAAATHATNGTELPAPDDLSTLANGYERFMAKVATPERLQRVVANRYLDWLRVDGEIAVFSSDDAAREALLCVRLDGWGLHEAALAATAPLRRRSFVVGEADTHVQPVLARAQAGDLLGPLTMNDSPLLIHVTRKTVPDLADETVLTRARRELVAEAAERELLNRITWYPPLP